MRLKLICAKDKSALTKATSKKLVCAQGHSYPIVAGIPVLLRDEIEPTIKLAQASLSRARALPGSIDKRCPDLYLESLGVSEAEKNLIVTLADAPATTVDPVVSVILAATNGNLYKHLIGRLTTYPIPRLPLPQGEGKLLLDIGCGWGRWSIAAARNGYKVVGIDPSLGVLLAAQRVAKSMNIDITYLKSASLCS